MGFSRGRSGGLVFHVLKNFPQFIVIHTVKGFGIVSKAEIDVFLDLSCFFDDLLDVGNLISGSSARGQKKVSSFQSQRKAMPKNAQTTAPLHSSHMLVKVIKPIR